MTANRYDEDGLLAAWLRDGIDVAPPRVVQGALQKAATTRQRRELAVIRRVLNVEGTAPINKHRSLRFGLAGMAGIVAVVAVVAVLTSVNLLFRGQSGPVGPAGSATPTANSTATVSATPATPAPANPTPPRATANATDLTDGLPAPLGTTATAVMEGRAALAALATRSGALAFSEAPQPDAASAVLFDAAETGDERAYSAAALTFGSAEAASSALRSIRTGFSSATGMWALGNSPFTNEHLPTGSAEGFERSGTWWAFGGTSAYTSSRVGHLNVWRVADVVFVAFGVDWMTTGTSEYQSTIEAGVISLSDYLTDRVR